MFKTRSKDLSNHFLAFLFVTLSWCDKNKWNYNAVCLFNNQNGQHNNLVYCEGNCNNRHNNPASVQIAIAPV
jgi:hypothetical protein